MAEMSFVFDGFGESEYLGEIHTQGGKVWELCARERHHKVFEGEKDNSYSTKSYSYFLDSPDGIFALPTGQAFIIDNKVMVWDKTSSNIHFYGFPHDAPEYISTHTLNGVQNILWTNKNKIVFEASDGGMYEIDVGEILSSEEYTPKRHFVHDILKGIGYDVERLYGRSERFACEELEEKIENSFCPLELNIEWEVGKGFCINGAVVHSVEDVKSAIEQAYKTQPLKAKERRELQSHFKELFGKPLPQHDRAIEI